ncbi:MAG: carbohydrate kinase [Kangiellaceae bacterium]|nr:carbohydrate kinase [Kangiellaceae bacterium]
MSTLLSYGEVLVDMIKVNEREPAVVFAGGAPANVAVCFSKLGEKSFFIGGLGGDSEAEFLREQLTINGVDLTYSKTFSSSCTAKAVVHLDDQNERTFQIFRDGTADTLLGCNDLDLGAFEQSQIFHFCSNTLTNEEMRMTTLSALRLARAANNIVCFDVNLRFGLWDELERLESLVSGCYQYCDLIKMSREELDYLARTNGLTPLSYIQKLKGLGVSLVLVTDGDKRIEAHTLTATLVVVPPSVKPQDTTAAGDAFIGGFLYSLAQLVNTRDEFHQLIISSEPLKEAVQFASKCGAIACLKKGAFSALPDLAQVKSFNPDKQRVNSKKSSNQFE